jgi:hypothetical protein
MQYFKKNGDNITEHVKAGETSVFQSELTAQSAAKAFRSYYYPIDYLPSDANKATKKLHYGYAVPK